MPSKKKRLNLLVSDNQDEAIRKYCDENGIEINPMVRDAVLRKIGRKDLLGEIVKGRPRNDDDY